MFHDPLIYQIKIHSFVQLNLNSQNAFFMKRSTKLVFLLDTWALYLLQRVDKHS